MYVVRTIFILFQGQKRDNIMKLKPQANQDLIAIMKQDYNLSLSVAEAECLGISLLRLSRLANIALKRAEEKESKSVTSNIADPARL